MYSPRDGNAADLRRNGIPQADIDEAQDARLAFEPEVRVKVVHADGTERVITLAEAKAMIFGDEHIMAHGPVKQATSLGRPRVDDGGFPNHTKLSRSSLSGLPIYGTGRIRP